MEIGNLFVSIQAMCMGLTGKPRLRSQLKHEESDLHHEHDDNDKTLVFRSEFKPMNEDWD